MLSAPKDTANDVNKSFSNAKRDSRDAWDKATDAKDNLEDAAHNAGRKVRHYLDTATDELTHASDSVKSHIRTKPVQSSIIALAAGFILGRLFRL
jgi:ElaB/YqjD/DUF883 family membrane-anchored ribosome-binding protein